MSAKPRIVTYDGRPVYSNFPVKPYKHQIDCLEQSKDREFFALLLDMGAGKTLICIANICYLYLEAKITGALIIAPKGVCPAWREQLKMNLWTSVPVTVSFWNPATADGGIIGQPYLGKLCILVMNSEALSTSRGALAAKKFLSLGRVFMVLDESSFFKNPRAARTRAAVKLGELAAYRRISTGMPVEQGPLDLYSQCEFLQPGLLGHRSFYSFRGEFCNVVPMTFGARRFPKVIGYRNLDKLTTLLKGFSTMVKKKDCLDLPPKVYQTVEVELTPPQELLYDKMREQAVIVLSQTEQSSASIVLTQLLRLHQIVMGRVVMDDGFVKEVPHNRINVLVQVIAETAGKVVIWANYTADIKDILVALSKTHGKDSYVAYYGDVNEKDRGLALERFEEDDSCRFFVGNQATAGMGLTLTASSTAIYYSNNYSVRQRRQSEDRLHRIGQKSSVTYIDLVSPDTIDTVILKALQFKRSLLDLVMNGGWRSFL